MRPSRTRAVTGRSVLLVAATGLFGVAVGAPLFLPAAAYAADRPGVSVEITPVGALEAGHDASWRVDVTNHGTRSASGLQAVIMLPDGLTYTASTSDAWSCAAAAMTVTCTHTGELTAGATSSATISAAVRTGAPRVLKVPVAVTEAGDSSLHATDEDVSVVTEVLGNEQDAGGTGTKVVSAPTTPASSAAQVAEAARHGGTRSSAAMIWAGALVLATLTFAVVTTRKGLWRIGR